MIPQKKVEDRELRWRVIEVFFTWEHRAENRVQTRKANCQTRVPQDVGGQVIGGQSALS